MSDYDREYPMPSDPKIREVFERIDTYVQPYHRKSSDEFYNKWAPIYDDDLKIIDCPISSKMIEDLKSVSALEICKHKTDGTFSVLDIGAGSGTMTERLQENGYKCPFDAIEVNSTFIQILNNKNVHRNIIQHLLTTDTQLPIKENIYDVVICVGALSATHIHADCVKDMIRVLKPGGWFWCSTRYTELQSPYNKLLEGVLTQLVEEKVIRIESQDKTPYYRFDADNNGKTVKVEIMAIGYLIEKL